MASQGRMCPSIGMPSRRSTVYQGQPVQRNGLTLGFLSALPLFFSKPLQLFVSWHLCGDLVNSVLAKWNDCFFYQHLLSRFNVTWKQSFSANVVRMQLGRNDFELANVNRIRSKSVNVSGGRERLKYSLDKRNIEDIEKHLLDTGPGSLDVSYLSLMAFLI